MIRKVFQEFGFHEIVSLTKFSDHNKAFAFLRNTTQRSVKHSIRNTVSSRMKYLQGILKFLGFQYAFNVFHNKPLGLDF